MATVRAILARFWPDCRVVHRRGDDDWIGVNWLAGNPRPRPDETDVRALSTACDLADLADRRTAEATRPLLDHQGLEMLAELHDAVLALADAAPRRLPAAAAPLGAVARRREALRPLLARLRGPRPAG